MKIHTKDYRIHEGEQVDLKKRPTIVDSVYGSKSAGAGDGNRHGPAD